MYKDKLIKTVHMDCPICDQIHDVEMHTRIATLQIKKDRVSYKETYFICHNTNNEECEFQTAKLVRDNLLNARDSYRRKNNLLTSTNIVNIRKKYKLSQVELAKLLGWGEATISRYETKAIQDEAHDMMLKIIRDDPLKALELLRRNKNKFSSKKYLEIKEQIVNEINTRGKEDLSRNILISDYVNYETPSDLNGYQLLNIDKIEAIVSYYAEKISHLYKVKLMKLLWYADVLSFNQYGHSLTGLVYLHKSMGALPIGHRNLVNLENINVVEEDGNDYEMFHFFPSKTADLSVLSNNEKNILDIVIKKFKNYNTEEISRYMHQEQAYQKTHAEEIIPFSLTKEIELK